MSDFPFIFEFSTVWLHTQKALPPVQEEGFSLSIKCKLLTAGYFLIQLLPILRALVSHPLPTHFLRASRSALGDLPMTCQYYHFSAPVHMLLSCLACPCTYLFSNSLLLTFQDKAWMVPLLLPAFQDVT